MENLTLGCAPFSTIVASEVQRCVVSHYLLFLSRSSFCASVSEARFALSLAFLLCLASSEAFVFALSCIIVYLKRNSCFTVTLATISAHAHMPKCKFQCACPVTYVYSIHMYIYRNLNLHDKCVARYARQLGFDMQPATTCNSQNTSQNTQKTRHFTLKACCSVDCENFISHILYKILQV